MEPTRKNIDLRWLNGGKKPEKKIMAIFVEQLLKCTMVEYDNNLEFIKNPFLHEALYYLFHEIQMCLENY